MNDYMAAYHDAVLLIGQVMRKIISKNESEVEEMEFMNVNYFRNTSFNGKREGAQVADLRPGSKLTCVYSTASNSLRQDENTVIR